jgi:hypothetical protein
LNEFEALFHQHAGPSLAAEETIECIARLYSGSWSQRHFIAGATAKRMVLVELAAGLLGPRPVFKGVRDVPYNAIDSLNTGAFFNQKRILINLQSGEFLNFGLNSLLTTVSGQTRFVSTLKALYHQYKLSPDTSSTSTSDSEIVDTRAMESARQQIRLHQNLGLGIIGGAIAAVLAAIIWAAISVFTGYQIGWMAIGVGLLVGAAVRVFGRGIDRPFGIAGAILSLAGCLIGNFLSGAYFFAQAADLPLPDALAILTRVPSLALELMAATFSPRDIVFYTIAAFSGYALAFQSARAGKRSTPPANV